VLAKNGVRPGGGRHHEVPILVLGLYPGRGSLPILGAGGPVRGNERHGSLQSSEQPQASHGRQGDASPRAGGQGADECGGGQERGERTPRRAGGQRQSEAG